MNDGSLETFAISKIAHGIIFLAMQEFALNGCSLNKWSSAT